MPTSSPRSPEPSKTVQKHERNAKKDEKRKQKKRKDQTKSVRQKSVRTSERGEHKAENVGHYNAERRAAEKRRNDRINNQDRPYKQKRIAQYIKEKICKFEIFQD